MIESDLFRKSEKAYHYMTKAWKKYQELYVNGIIVLPLSIHSVVFGAYFIQHLVDSKCTKAVETVKVYVFLIVRQNTCHIMAICDFIAATKCLINYLIYINKYIYVA